jgi:NAD+ synthase
MAKAERIAKWMRERVHEAGARGIVVGLSGGVDSAVVARLAQLAAPGATLGVLMPCNSDPADERDARLVATHFSVPTVKVDLGATHAALIAESQKAVDPLRNRADIAAASAETERTLANVKPRLRMTTLYFVANSLNYLVAGTGNRSEIAVGYFTKWGDGGVDMLPIGRLLKSQVRALARELGVPPEIVERVPSAGLWQGQSDEHEMGFTYDQLERYLEEGADGVPPALAMKIERLVRSTSHKRELPAMPD